MKEVLTEYQKYWIYKKFFHFFKNDACFKYFQTDLLLLNFYDLLLLSSSFDSFIHKLKTSEIDFPLTLPRKESVIDNQKKQLNYEYPKLSFQVESLIDCWEEICYIQKEFSKENLDDLLRNEVEFSLSEDDEFIIPKSSKKRKCFGNKPNYFIRYKRESLEDFTIFSHERNLGLPLRINFQREYNLFDVNITNRCKEILKEKENKLLFIQTDLQAFYHKLSPAFLIEFFEKSPVLRNSNILKWIKILYQTHDFEGLPIGWILSGFIANIILLDLNKILNDKIPLELKNQSEIKLNGFSINNIKIYSYVDDFVILLPIKSHETEFFPKIKNSILECCNRILNQRYGTYILFHDPKHNPLKCKSFLIDHFSLSKLKRNFHDMKLSIPPEIEFGFEVNELMTVHDPELTTNERNQFSVGLTAAKRSLAKGDEISTENIKELLENMLNKIKNTEGKYIQRVFGILTLIVERENNGIKFTNPKPGKIKKHVYTCINSIFDILKNKENHPISEWAVFLISFARFIFDTNGDVDLFKKYYTTIKSKTLKKTSKEVNIYLDLIILEIKLLSQKNNKIFKIRKNSFSSKNIFLNNLKSNYTLILNKREGKSLHNSNLRKRGIRSLEILILLNAMYFRIFSNYIPNDNLIDEYLRDIEFYKNNKKQIGLFLSHSLFAIFEHCGDTKCIESVSKLKENLKNVQGVSAVQFINILSKNLKYFKDYSRSNELKRFNEQLNLYTHLFKKEKFSIPLAQMYQRKEVVSFYLAITYLFTCSKLNEIITFLSHSLLPIEGQQWMPWRSTTLSFQIVGDKSLRLLEIAYNLKIGTYRNEEISQLEYNKLYKKIKLFINDIKENEFSNLFSITDVNFSHLIPLYSNTKKEFKITIAPISYDLNDFLNENTLDFKNENVKKTLKLKIDGAVEEAITRKSSLLVIPEMTLPTQYLNYFLTKVALNDIILIAGLEYFNDGNEAQNITIISIPVNKFLNPLGRNYIVFNQVKNFPMAEEKEALLGSKLEYKSNNNIYIFKTNEWCNFSVLTCSDFLSLTLRRRLQKKIQTLIVPAQNYDNNTYESLANSCIRDLHCIAVICNNGSLSKSFTLAPFYKNEQRTVFEHAGLSYPEFHTFSIDPKEIKFVQENGRGDKPFRTGKNKKPNTSGYNKKESDILVKYKQLPPDWDYF
ncbi:reverse transcriptase domain-containing protein [Leptospira interrogans]|uniref:reverse transcriptase domain-containing protein n=1 Tax=Leptospira interrogans TaxID=173 RepID=UPI00122D2748|nr:reverse transcriptase domain-containing protein [Leptospira interrogans]KAA1265149.1 RNA-directed DNA polymerase [Leptospira interrogans serovar Weerasinghe]UMQ56827.1 RNA-directed DNA polymerase [Leptospira interrogans]UNE69222.1 reverse transcriptase domain-containing protein [Leptospira interrogans]